MTYDNMWRDHPDYRDELDFSNDPRWRYAQTPGGRFGGQRRKQEREDKNDLVRLIIDVKRKQGARIDRSQMKTIYRTLREHGYHLHEQNLYAPTPPKPGPTWEDMQTSTYWFAEAEKLAKVERQFNAAAKTFAFTGHPDLAEHYERMAEEVHVARLESEGEAITNLCYEQNE